MSASSPRFVHLFAILLLLLTVGASAESTANCTDEQIQQTYDLYVAAGKTAECAANATVNGMYVWINFYCDDACEPVMVQLAQDLPDCYNGLSNSKTVLQGNIDFCNGDYATTTEKPTEILSVSSSDSDSTIVIATTQPPTTSASASAASEAVSASASAGGETTAASTSSNGVSDTQSATSAAASLLPRRNRLHHRRARRITWLQAGRRINCRFCWSRRRQSR